MGLFPCSVEELKSLGFVDFRSKHSDVVQARLAAADPADPTVVNGNGTTEAENGGVIRPDVSQMIPFKV